MPLPARTADAYRKGDVLGRGFYGKVYHATCLKTGQEVALKKVKPDPDGAIPRSTLREIKTLQELQHPNIVRLVEVVMRADHKRVFLALEYVEHDLVGLCKYERRQLCGPQIKCLMQQLLQALAYMHGRGHLHRDLKPANLLVTRSGVLKLADFGLARPMATHVNLTPCVVTFWFRAPELLLSAANYTAAIDVWSAGTIIAELLQGAALLPGRNEDDQLDRTFRMCGPPTDWPEARDLPGWSDAWTQRPEYERRLAGHLASMGAEPAAVSLVDALLVLNPARRPTAAAALDHVWFSQWPLACNASSVPGHTHMSLEWWPRRCHELDVKKRHGLA